MNRGYEVKMDPQAMQATGLGKEEVRPAMKDAMERLEQSIKSVENDLGGLRERLADGVRLMGWITHLEGFPACTCEWCAWKRNVKDALGAPAKLEDAVDSFLRNTAKMGKEPASSPDLNDAKWPGSCGECEQECDPKCPRFASASKPKVVRTPLGARLDAVVKALMEWADHAAGKGDSATAVVLRGLARELDKE